MKFGNCMSGRNRVGTPLKVTICYNSRLSRRYWFKPKRKSPDHVTSIDNRSTNHQRRSRTHPGGSQKVCNIVQGQGESKNSLKTLHVNLILPIGPDRQKMARNDQRTKTAQPTPHDGSRRPRQLSGNLQGGSQHSAATPRPSRATILV